MRVGILALLQESNTFAPGATMLEDFKADLFLSGESVRTQLAEAHHEVSGFFAGLCDANVVAVPVFAARAVPWGAMTNDTLRALCKALLAAVDAAGDLDGFLVAAHGATVSQEVFDVDGYWLGELRRRVGPDRPIIGTLDLHANLSPRMVAACNAFVAYRTNPHLDQRERGREAAQIMYRTLCGEIRPTQAAAFPPLAIGIECQHTSEPPCRDLFQQLNQLLCQPHVLSASVLLGFPYADVPEMGSATLVVTDKNTSLAQSLADQMAEWMWLHRTELVRLPVSLADAVSLASQAPGPVCLLDVGDNVGGGGPADATYLVHALRSAGVGPTLACLYDPEVAGVAHQVGIGGEVDLEVGGKMGVGSGPSIRGPFSVLQLSPGIFTESQPRHGGFVQFNQGPTAVLKGPDGLMILVNSRRTPPFSLAQLTSCGVDPTTFRVIVAKGVHAPVAAYEEVCKTFIRVDTPGVTTADVRRLPFCQRHVPMYPFEPECVYADRTGEFFAS